MGHVIQHIYVLALPLGGGGLGVQLYKTVGYTILFDHLLLYIGKQVRISPDKEMEH